MIHWINKNIFSFKSMIAVSFDTRSINNDKFGIKITNGMQISVRRIIHIDQEYENKLKQVLDKMDFKPPFNIEVARNRLASGYHFVILENNNRIIGWTWAAIKKVFFNDFNCIFNLRDADAFSFNTFILADFRGNKLAQVLLSEQLLQLQQTGCKRVWALIYKHNIASKRAYLQNGWKEIGNYKFVKLLFMNFKFPPSGLKFFILITIIVSINVL